MKGAAATSSAIFLARSGKSGSAIRQEIVSLFGYDLSQSVDEIRPAYRYNERAQDTVPQALTCALEATSFEDAIRNSISIGGDSDTIAAIAGGVAEARFGIPESIARIAWLKLPEDIKAAITELYNTAEHRSKHPSLPRITIVEGSILDQLDCDGLVNSANENLRAGSGVCGAIHAAAGHDLETYSHKLAPLSVGAAVPTPGFRLPQRMVIHTRGPKYHFDPEPSSHLAKAMTSTLRIADQQKLTRIAVPAISMGVYGYPPHEAIPILVDAARKMLPRLHYVQEIRFVVVQRTLHDIFRNYILEEQ
jgi:O-acetyl-ADP-ribose deacetylase (regulator of RNase III)